MIPLYRHAQTPQGATIAVEAEVDRTPAGLTCSFSWVTPGGALQVPPPSPPGRADELWRTTCGELFIGLGGSAYLELNLSPSGQWAAWRFDGERRGRSDYPASIAIRTRHHGGELQLEADVTAAIPPLAPLLVAAVAEEADGAVRLWASAHAPGAPDFHRADVRHLILDEVGAA